MFRWFRKLSLKRAQLTSLEREALLEFKRRVKARLGAQLYEVQLFGSRARRDARPDSDIDILMVVERDTLQIRDAIHDVVGEILDQYESYLSVKIFGEDEYKRLKSLPTVFFQLVSRDAITV